MINYILAHLVNSSSLDESGGTGDQGDVDELPVKQASPQPYPSTSRELDDIPKPKAKQGKQKKDNEEIQRILNLMENSNDQDEIDLALAAISKCMKRSLN